MRRSSFNNALKLFEAEQQALREGKIACIAEIGAQKDAIVADLANLKLSQEQALRLKEQATKSAAMLAAALEGVKEAQKRLIALQNIREGLSVYGADGNRQTVAQSNTALHHKV